MPAETAIKLAVVEDVASYRATLVRTLNARPGWKVVAACSGADQALRMIPSVAPDLVLLDLHLPGRCGIDLIRPLRARLPGTRVVMLTVEDRAQLIVQALESGACGYIIKGGSAERLRGSLQEALEGGATIGSAVARRIVQWFHEHVPKPAPQNFGLSERQWQVLQLAARGKQRGEIALALGIELNTVKIHLRNIFEKLGAHSINEALIHVRQTPSLLDAPSRPGA